MPNLSRAAQQSIDNLLSLGKAVQSGSLLAESKEITPIQAKALKMIKVAVVRNEGEELSGREAVHVLYTRRPPFVAAFVYGFFEAISPMGPEFMSQAIGSTMALLKKAGTAKGEAASEEKVMEETISRTIGQVKSWKPSPTQKEVQEKQRGLLDEPVNGIGIPDHLEKMTESMLKDIQKDSEPVNAVEMIVEGVPGEVIAGQWIPLPIAGVRINSARVRRIVVKLARRGVGCSKALVILNALNAASGKNA
jgi:hypothetical protein